MMKLNLPPIQKRGIALFTDLKEGFKYAFGFPPIRAILLLLALVSIMGMPYTVLMPIFAKDILHGGPHTMGFLMGSVGVGAIIGAIYLASRKSVIGLTRVVVFATSLFGTGLMLFSLSQNLFLSMGLLLLVGMGMMLQMATSNTLLQTLVDDDKRGRVMSFYNMSFFGMAPLGSFLAGSLASKIGTPATVAIGGITCIIGALIFLKSLPQLRKFMRPIYVKKGIIPEVAEGLQAAANISNRPQN